MNYPHFSYYCRSMKVYMKDFVIREAVLEELPVLLTFEQGIIEAERPFDPTLKPDPISYYDIAELIQSEDSTVYIAEYEGELVASGYARIQTPKPFLKHEKFAFLGFMYVKPGFRGKGLNARIVQALADWSKNRGIDEIRLHVYAENTSAIRAYEKAGFTSHLIEMRHNLSE